MPQTPSDEELLDIFVKSRNEQAFRHLAERYSGLIFHTALRFLNDRTLAEDVAQRVLGALANKASQVASENSPLPAWLHRTTILEAKSARRSESRHHRKKEALMRAPNDSRHSGDSTWQDALPHLDAAIDILPEADRHVLLLHFINEMTFPEIARHVGKSAAAVQKQSRRALENLQRILGKRGITLSLGILTAGLTTEMVKAGPVLLIPTLSTLSILGKSTSSALIVKKTTVAAIGTTLLLCGIPLARQQVAVSDLEVKLKNMADVPPLVRTASRRANSTSLSMPERLARDLKAQDRDVPRYLAAVDHIEELRAEELIALIKETVASPMPLAHQEILFGKLFDTLAIQNPELALNTLLDPAFTDYLASNEQMRSRFVGCLGILTDKDSRKSLEWFRSHLKTVCAIQPKGSFPADYWENAMRNRLAYGLLSSDADGVIEVLTPLPSENLKAAFDEMATRMDPFPVEKIAVYVRSARSLLPAKEVGEALAKLVTRQVPVGRGSMPYEAVDKLLTTGSFLPAEIDSISKHAGYSRITNHSGGLAAGIIQYKTWLETHLADGVDRNLGETLGRIALSSDGPAYQEILNRQKSEPSDDMIAGFLTVAGRKYDEHRIKQLTDSLTDQDLAMELIRQIKKETGE